MNSKLVGGALPQAVRGNRSAESMSSARDLAQRPARSTCDRRGRPVPAEYAENDNSEAIDVLC
jgi:hypothetical protein